MKWLLVLVLMFVGSNITPVMAQISTSEQLANDLRRNVVRVNTRWTSGAQRSGFGFLVGERGGLVYIVTADHVVRDENLVAGVVGITFYFDQGREYSGDVLDTHLMKSAGDVAVIRIRPPAGLSWRRNAPASRAAARGDDVWYVGLQGAWYVPVRPGAISSIEPNGEIRFEGLAIRPGTSGGPLIGKSGIMGMIIKDDDIFGTATSVEVIARAFQEWVYPWELASPSDTGGQTQPLMQVEYSKRDNRDIWQQDIPLPNGSIGLHGVDMDECERRCTSNPKCLAFAYDRWNKSCYQKSAAPGSLLDPHSMIAVKKPGEIPKVSQKDIEIALLRGKRMHGTLHRNSTASDFDACKAACNQELSCVAFNFVKRTAKDNCEMYKASEGYDSDATVDAGYKHQTP